MLTFNFSPFPVISTPRLVLRRITIADATNLHFLRSNKTVLRYIDKNPETSVAKTRKFIKMLWAFEKKGAGINWAITLKGTDTLIGNICLWNIRKEHHRAELGYTLQPVHHRKGLMHEAVKAVLKAGFKKYKFHSIEANVNPKNKASIKLLEKNKFKQEAYYKENYFFKGKFLDSVIYSLITPSRKKIRLRQRKANAHASICIGGLEAGGNARVGEKPVIK